MSSLKLSPGSKSECHGIETITHETFWVIMSFLPESKALFEASGHDYDAIQNSYQRRLIQAIHSVAKRIAISRDYIPSIKSSSDFFWTMLDIYPDLKSAFIAHKCDWKKLPPDNAKFLESIHIVSKALSPDPRPENLVRGNSGPFVEELQANLVILGYTIKSPHGHFGPGTQEAVIQFQIAKGIITNRKSPAAGIFNLQTRTVLEEELKKKESLNAAKLKASRTTIVADIQQKVTKTISPPENTQGHNTGTDMARVEVLPKLAFPDVNMNLDLAAPYLQDSPDKQGNQVVLHIRPDLIIQQLQTAIDKTQQEIKDLRTELQRQMTRCFQDEVDVWKKRNEEWNDADSSYKYLTERWDEEFTKSKNYEYGTDEYERSQASLDRRMKVLQDLGAKYSEFSKQAEVIFRQERKKAIAKITSELSEAEKRLEQLKSAYAAFLQKISTLV